MLYKLETQFSVHQVKHILCTQQLECSMAPLIALTVQDAVKMNAQELKLIHRNISAIPAGLSVLSSLTSLDLSDNPLKQFDPACLPTNLKELVLTGCQLSAALPCGLSRLSALKQLVASANNITDIESILSCQHLLHVGLAYNHICTLSDPGRPWHHASATSTGSNKAPSLARSKSKKGTNMLPFPNTICLDLSHNDITDLDLVLDDLRQLPKLRALQLRGNPISLLPQYKSSVLQHLPQLVYLDGQRLNDLRHLPQAPPAAVGSFGPPATTTRLAHAATTLTAIPGQSPTPAVAAHAATDLSREGTPRGCQATEQPGAGGSMAAGFVTIVLELDQLQISEDSADRHLGLLEEAAAQLQQLVPATLAASPTSNQSRPATAASMVESKARSSAVTGAAASAAKISDGVLKGNQQSTTACGDITSDGVQQQPSIPLLPVRYHLEASGPDGTCFCGAALAVEPRAPPVVDSSQTAAALPAGTAVVAPQDSKKGTSGKSSRVPQDGKAAVANGKAAPDNPAQGGNGKASGPAAKSRQGEPDASATQGPVAGPQPGRLRVQLTLPADVATRDWLRSGFAVKLYRTQYRPVPQLIETALDGTTAGAAAAASQQHHTASKAGLCSTSGSTACVGVEMRSTTTTVSWQHVMQQKKLGSARVSGPMVVECGGAAGADVEAQGSAVFYPDAPLLDPQTHVRLSLVDAQKLLKAAAGSCSYSLSLVSV